MKKIIISILTICTFASCSTTKNGCPSQDWLIGGGHYNSAKFKNK